MGQTTGPHAGAKTKARNAAEAWLARTDDDDFEESWDTGAELFQDRIDESAWIDAAEDMSDVRESLSSRVLLMSRFRRTVEGAVGAGPFVILTYRSIFEAGPYQELVLTVREGDDWRVAGYRITPLHQDDPSDASEAGP